MEQYYGFANMTVILRVYHYELFDLINSILCDLNSDNRENVISEMTVCVCEGAYILKEDNRILIESFNIHSAAIEISSEIINKFVHNSEKLLFLHAGAVQKNGKVVIIVGQSKSGKTSLVSNLINQYGFTFLSDEIVPIDLETGFVLSFRRSLSIRNETLCDLILKEKEGRAIRTIDEETVRFISFKNIQNGIEEDTINNSVELVIFPYFGSRTQCNSINTKNALALILKSSVNFRKVVNIGIDYIIKLLKTRKTYELEIDNIKSAAQYISRLFEQEET